MESLDLDAIEHHTEIALIADVYELSGIPGIGDQAQLGGLFGSSHRRGKIGRDRQLVRRQLGADRHRAERAIVEEDLDPGWLGSLRPAAVPHPQRETLLFGARADD